MTTTKKLTEHDIDRYLEALVRLLQDSVADGASVGFIAPLSDSQARAYWQQARAEIAQNRRIALAAIVDEQLAGIVQLELNSKQNALHRAEVQKLMVNTNYRKQGIGQKLMETLEDAAKEQKIKLIVLDTRPGDQAERLYRKLDYIEAGVIPQYALSSGGTLDATVYFYKLL